MSTERAAMEISMPEYDRDTVDDDGREKRTGQFLYTHTHIYIYTSVPQELLVLHYIYDYIYVTLYEYPSLNIYLTKDC